MPASSAIVNTTLTNYAQGYSNDLEKTLADFIAPVVPTGIASGQYKEYSDKDAFQVLDTSRGLGGERNVIEFGTSDPTFNCQPQGLKALIDDHERMMAGESGVLNLQQAKIATLISSAKTGHEAKVFAAIYAAKAATGSVGVWSNAAKDPIDEIDAQIEAISNATGLMPNRMAFGLGAWRAFKNHANVISRQPGSVNIGVTTEQAAGMFLNPSMDIRIGTMTRDTTKAGKAKATQNIAGAEVLIFFGSDSPTTYDASFAKTFSVDGSMIGAVKEWRDEDRVSDAYATDWSEDIKVTASEAGRRITVS